MAQWLRIHLSMQGTWVREDPTCRGATANTVEQYLQHAGSVVVAHVPQLLILHAANIEAHAPRARAPQQEKPPQ